MSVADRPTRWYPSERQLKDKRELERSFRQLLDQHYRLVDEHTALKAAVRAMAQAPPPPDPGGATNTMIVGLRVLPVDTQVLADGAKLTWVKSAGNFQFKL